MNKCFGIEPVDALALCQIYQVALEKIQEYKYYHPSVYKKQILYMVEECIQSKANDAWSLKYAYDFCRYVVLNHSDLCEHVLKILNYGFHSNKNGAESYKSLDNALHSLSNHINCSQQMSDQILEIYLSLVQSKTQSAESLLGIYRHLSVVGSKKHYEPLRVLDILAQGGLSAQNSARSLKGLYYSLVNWLQTPYSEVRQKTFNILQNKLQEDQLNNREFLNGILKLIQVIDKRKKSEQVKDFLKIALLLNKEDEKTVKYACSALGEILQDSNIELNHKLQLLNLLHAGLLPESSAIQNISPASIEGSKLHETSKISALGE